MVAKNKLLTAPPYAVEQALKKLGSNLRTARIRRNMTIENVAERIGTGKRAVMLAEKGAASTTIAVYAALLWLYGMLSPVDELADPANDKEGLALEASKGRNRSREKKGLDNDF
jgi:transcriptional regulator with XRE-family HTH domain